MKKNLNITKRKTLPEKAKQIKHYIQHSRLSYNEISKKVGLKGKQAVYWYVKNYDI
jgi:hypothetical protein